MTRFLFFYLMRRAPEAVRRVVPQHVDYWRERSPADYLGGPFADRTGGLITFSAASLDAAEQLVRDDPFMRDGLIEQHWLREWLAG